MTQKEHDKKVNNLKNNLKKAEKQIQDIRKELDELDKVKIEPESRRWMPNDGQSYYFIADSGEVFYDTWYRCRRDLLRFAIGNVFETREEAEFEVERLKVIAELKEFAEPEDKEWNSLDEHYAIIYDHNRDEVCTEYWSVLHMGSIYFESKERATEAIKVIGKDRIKKYYLRMKE